MESFWSPRIFFDTRPSPNQLRFEGNRVRQILSAFGLADRIPLLVRDYQGRWGEQYNRLTFESFHRFFPTFPFVVEAQSFFRTSEDDTPSLRFSALLDRFDVTFVAKRYNFLLDRYEYFSGPGVVMAEPVPPESRGLPLAMPFPFDGVRHGLVVHNAPGPVGLGSFFTGHLTDSRGDLLRVRVEKFDDWLDRLVILGWSPASPPPALPRPPRGPTHLGAWVEPWMLVATGGAGNDTYLLAWLYRVCDPAAGPAEAMMRHADESGTWVLIPGQHSEVRFGITPSQLKRAVSDLKRRGFVTVGQRKVNGRLGRVARLEHAVIDEARRAAEVTR